MPELPEVETTLLAIAHKIKHLHIQSVHVYQPSLRLKVPDDLHDRCKTQKVLSMVRRAKYLIIHLNSGHILIHLGMSGHLRLLSADQAPKKHDHVDIIFNENVMLRYHDPRRFGLIDFIETEPNSHALLANLGPEPLSEDFSAEYLQGIALNKKRSIKQFIMDGHIVVGVGNIYATEALFFSHIHPLTPVNQLSLQQFEDLVINIKLILKKAIQAGGTSLKDFYAPTGKKGYFSLALSVYGRQGLPCFRCNALIKTLKISGRASAFCPNCQPSSVKY